MALSRPLAEPLVDLVAGRFRLLGQPVRVRLIERLDRLGEAHVQDLADDLAVTQQNTSKHLGVLFRAGLVERRKEGRISVYTLADLGTFELIERVATSTALQLRNASDDPWHSSGA